MITPEQRARRRGCIGSSDAAAIMGLDPFKSAFAVYCEKVFDVEDLEETEAIARGNRYEGPLVDWLEGKLEEPIERNVELPWITPATTPRGANLDGRMVRHPRVGVEAKVTSFGEEFGEEETDQVPARIIIQTHHAMGVGDMEAFWVPVLLARRGRPQECLYRVDRNEDLISTIAAREEQFWAEHVLARRPPPRGIIPALDVLERIKRVPKKIVPIEPRLVEALEFARAMKREAEAKERAAKEEILAALGDAEAGDFGDDRQLLTYFEQSRRGYTVAPTSFRVARVAKR